MPLDDLDDLDYPAYTIGQAAGLLGVRQAFLRSLDTADLVRPVRSDGGHRRYTRRQLELVARVRVLFDEGHSLAATTRIIELEDLLAAARGEVAELRERLGEP
ncbi:MULTISPECIES: MerR family transcriptional regulator [Actinokineospora]|uniref:MerR family transcriptional regulator n=1 Tax=Actinokineospora fastidiosa TaxID=1816 RepID=A0A918GGH0_9PSEU|nr:MULTISPECIES: MerR family transcriptional regulator [Actinokineospora]UVS80366.1 Putative heat shock protein HspR [Actinokineospora sp. UTMC 2448]GGS34771.1 MerR family transcriptional regulator [Actinokineospora fastidiosa]